MVNVLHRLRSTSESHVGLVDLLPEPSQPDHPENTGDDKKPERGSQDTDVASRIEEPCSEGQRDEIGKIPDKPKSCQAYHSISVANLFLVEIKQLEQIQQ